MQGWTLCGCLTLAHTAVRGRWKASWAGNAVVSVLRIRIGPKVVMRLRGLETGMVQHCGGGGRAEGACNKVGEGWIVVEWRQRN